MKKNVILLFLILAVFSGCSKEKDVNISNESMSQFQEQSPRLKVSSTSSTWHSLTQVQRNQAILVRAYQDNGVWVKKNCKEWASAVVASASGGATTLPLTDPSDWYWAASSYVEGRSALLQVAQPGELVQMKLVSGGPHTAIVYSITSSQVTFIESNWCKPATCLTVNLRTITFATFYSQVSNYTLYKIL